MGVEQQSDTLYAPCMEYFPTFGWLVVSNIVMEVRLLGGWFFQSHGSFWLVASIICYFHTYPGNEKRAPGWLGDLLGMTN